MRRDQRNLALSPSPLRIVLIYAAFGAGWILFSDLLMSLLFPASQLGAVSIVKGWLFIAVTSLILTLLLRRYHATRVCLENELRQLNLELENRVTQRTHDLEKAKATLLKLVAEQKQSAKLLTGAYQEMKTFSYSVSHDLRAPLRGIDGYSQLLEEGYHDRLDEEGRQFLANIRRDTAQMNQLIRDLLYYSRMERRDLHSNALDLPSIVQAVTDEVNLGAAQLRLKIPPATVNADRIGLTMVLRNLLANAVKFSRSAQPPVIEIGARCESQKVLLWVRDNGIGFDMQVHDQIFEIFERLQRSADYPGTGIGLALVHKAMQRMGGRVWAESSPGAGATFYLELPG